MDSTGTGRCLLRKSSSIIRVWFEINPVERSEYLSCWVVSVESKVPLSNSVYFPTDIKPGGCLMRQ